MAILHKNITASGDIHNPKWHPDANNGDYAWKNEKGELESIDELLLPAALNFVDGSVSPPTSNTNDIYILSSGGSVNAGWGSVALQDWVKYDGAAWNAITPQKSSLCYDKTADSLMSFDGAAWAAIGGGGVDPNAVHVNTASEISGITAKATPTTSDLLIIEDAADSNNKKKITIGDLPSSGGSTFGIFGISDSSGEYTYYTTIELALSAASSGDTIEQFSDVSVSTASSVTLDKSITWNMNGYEYKNTSTSSFIMLNLPNNTTIDLTINNGQFVRNTGSSNGGTLFYMGNKILTKINSNGVIYNNVEGQCVDGKADITGGTFKSAASSILGFYFQGIAHNIKVYSVRTNQLVNTGCRIYNSYFYASVDYTILTGGAICYNTIFESPASYGVRLGTGTTTELNNCVAKGLFGAIFMQGGSIYNCTGISTGGFGIEMGNANARAFNSVGISPATNGFSISGLAEAYNCTALATSGYAVIMQNDGKFKNGTAKTTFNNANGHGIFITGVPVSGGFEVVGCEIITTNASANAIDGASGAQGKYAQNSFKGMTTSIGLVTSNLATNTTDGQGNLLL
jgi:hypothetical protein